MGAALAGVMLAQIPLEQSALGGETIECHGGNMCKAKGACGGPGYSCAGNNACLGKGFVEVKTQAECDALKANVKKEISRRKKKSSARA